MNDDEMISVAVRLAGYEYRFACATVEREELLEAADHLDQRMREVRDRSGKPLNLEAIAVMTALNLSHELLRLQRQRAEADAVVNRQVQDLLQIVDDVLSKTEPVEV
ncbi:MAG: cell division protein ZapA [Candidatus Competibacteraceae bacterium]|jgi:cell division protein ZapA|nr:MAG: cell division protein ZapA [Candidatus Competibacteraceae bacterium]